MNPLIIEDFLNLIDIFGFNLSFRYNNYSQYRTKLGGLATIAFGILIILFFDHSSQDIYNKTNPKVRQSVEYKEDVTIQSPEFLFGLYFSDSDLNLLKFAEGKKIEDYFEFWAIKRIRSYNKSENNDINIEFKKCNKTMNKVLFSNAFFTKQNNEENEAKIKNTYCLELKDFQLQNALNEFPKKSLSLYVKKIKSNETSKINKRF
jgi:hypothetical protein